MNENNAAKTKATKNLNHIPYSYSGANERAKMIDLLLLPLFQSKEKSYFNHGSEH